jgi:hypothetical protein
MKATAFVVTVNSFVKDVEQCSGIQKLIVLTNLYEYLTTPESILHLKLRTHPHTKDTIIKTCIRINSELKEVYLVETPTVSNARVTFERFLNTIDSPPPPPPRRSRRIQSQQMMANA